jgi:RNA polymerase sigma factor (sigma-70 family)
MNRLTYPGPLTRERERELLEACILRGDKAALNELVACNMRFVVQMAGRFICRRNWDRHKLDQSRLDDLIQEGAVFMYRAIPKFNLSFPFRLITFIGKGLWRRFEAVYSTDCTIKRPEAASPGCREAWCRAWSTRTLDSLDYDETPCVDHLFPDESVGDDVLLEAMRQAVGSLPGRLREVVLARLRGEKLQAIGNRMGISKERVRQLQTRATEKLQDMLLPRTKQWDPPDHMRKAG